MPLPSTRNLAKVVQSYFLVLFLGITAVGCEKDPKTNQAAKPAPSDESSAPKRSEESNQDKESEESSENSDSDTGESTLSFDLLEGVSRLEFTIEPGSIAHGASLLCCNYSYGDGALLTTNESQDQTLNYYHFSSQSGLTKKEFKNGVLLGFPRDRNLQRGREFSIIQANDSGVSYLKRYADFGEVPELRFQSRVSIDPSKVDPSNPTLLYPDDSGYERIFIHDGLLSKNSAMLFYNSNHEGGSELVQRIFESSNAYPTINNENELVIPSHNATSTREPFEYCKIDITQSNFSEVSLNPDQIIEYYEKGVPSRVYTIGKGRSGLGEISLIFSELPSGKLGLHYFLTEEARRKCGRKDASKDDKEEFYSVFVELDQPADDFRRITRQRVGWYSLPIFHNKAMRISGDSAALALPFYDDQNNLKTRLFGWIHPNSICCQANTAIHIGTFSLNAGIPKTLQDENESIRSINIVHTSIHTTTIVKTRSSAQVFNRTSYTSKNFTRRTLPLYTPLTDILTAAPPNLVYGANNLTRNNGVIARSHENVVKLIRINPNPLYSWDLLRTESKITIPGHEKIKKVKWVTAGNVALYVLTQEEAKESATGEASSTKAHLRLYNRDGEFMGIHLTAKSADDLRFQTIRLSSRRITRLTLLTKEGQLVQIKGQLR